MAHESSTKIDEHLHFTINKNRSIAIPEGSENIGVLADHNCERVTFDCFRYYDGHDLSKCGYPYKNYIKLINNVEGIYTIDDVTVDESDSDIIHFSWLVSGNVTGDVGEFAFAINFRDVDDDGNIAYSFNTVYTGGVFVLKGLLYVYPGN